MWRKGTQTVKYRLKSDTKMHYHSSYQHNKLFKNIEMHLINLYWRNPKTEKQKKTRYAIFNLIYHAVFNSRALKGKRHTDTIPSYLLCFENNIYENEMDKIIKCVRNTKNKTICYYRMKEIFGLCREKISIQDLLQTQAFIKTKFSYFLKRRRQTMQSDMSLIHNAL